MNLKCTFGFHAWSNCECAVCGKYRNKQHAWVDCKCPKCYKVRDDNHAWKGCKCATCGKLRDLHHDFRKGCKCATCGVNQDEHHDWDQNLQCLVCGEPAPEWISRLAHYLTMLPTTDIPKGAEPSVARHSLKTALNWTAEHVKKGYRSVDASPHSFTIGREISGGSGAVNDRFRYASEIGRELCLSLRWGFSEDSITVKKHGDDAYSIETYYYLQSDDDGGHYRYV